MVAAPPIRRLNPTRQKLKRYLEKRWSDGDIPIKPAEIKELLGIDDSRWAREKEEIFRWMDIAKWKLCQKKIYRDRPAQRGFWPPLRPAPRIDEWSDYDD
jgi:hypothetical protein